MAVVQQGEEQEDHAGKIELLWVYNSTQVETDGWFLGQVEVHAPLYDDTPQNYTVSDVARMMCVLVCYVL